MVDLRYALQHTHLIEATIDDDWAHDQTSVDSTPYLEVTATLVGSDGRTLARVVPEWGWVRLEPNSEGDCAVLVGSPDGPDELVGFAPGSESEDFEESVARVLLARDLGLPVGPAPALRDLRRAAGDQRRLSPTLLAEARRALEATVLWDSRWVGPLDLAEVEEIRNESLDALSSGFDRAGLGGDVILEPLLSPDGTAVKKGPDLLREVLTSSEPAMILDRGGELIVSVAGEELAVRGNAGGLPLSPHLAQVMAPDLTVPTTNRLSVRELAKSEPGTPALPEADSHRVERASR